MKELHVPLVAALYHIITQSHAVCGTCLFPTGTGLYFKRQDTFKALVLHPTPIPNQTTPRNILAISGPLGNILTSFDNFKLDLKILYASLGFVDSGIRMHGQLLPSVQKS